MKIFNSVKNDRPVVIAFIFMAGVMTGLLLYTRLTDTKISKDYCDYISKI